MFWNYFQNIILSNTVEINPPDLEEEGVPKEDVERLRVEASFPEREEREEGRP